MAAKTIRDALLRRRWFLTTLEILWLVLAFVLAIVASQATSLSFEARFVVLAIAALLYVSGLSFIPSRWLRCLRCGYPFGRLPVRRRKSLQVKVCPHCGQALDAPLDQARTP